ncbi:MAG: hypothetical protein IT426_12750 [Pirellulales bacterium]|nr:hypothetical protein [Pirellulales bacterium]
MSIPFKELSGSPLESFGPRGMKAQRRLICAWPDRRLLVQELLGDGYEFGGNAPANYPGSPNIAAVKLEVEPLADDMVRQDLTNVTEGLNGYRGFAKITVHYELLAAPPDARLPQDAPPNTFLTYEMDLDADAVRIPGGDLFWPGNAAAVFPAAAQGEVRLPVTVHRLTWHRVVSPPWTAIRACQGALNDGEFLGVAAGALLFDGVRAIREFLSLPDLDDPRFGWRLEYRFREKPLITAAAAPLFRSEDFAPLFRFEELS